LAFIFYASTPLMCAKTANTVTDTKAGELTVENILRGSDGWKPAVGELD